MKKEILQKFKKEVAIEMMLQGKTQADIGLTLGITAQNVSACFKYYNMAYMRRSFPVNDTFFDNIDSEEKAYILGYLIADGCVKEEIRKKNNSYRIAFSQAIQDEETIKLIHSLICPEAKLVYIDNSKYPTKRCKQNQINLQWTSKYMFDILVNKYGIKPRKTYDKNYKLPEGVIPDDLFRHFIRGFFDGDGHVDTNSLEFVFTSEPFMKQILSWFKNFNYRIYHCKGKTTDWWKVVITLDKKEKACIKSFFYDNSKYFLSRKKNIFNTEITYSIANRAISIVEHSAE